MKKTLFLMALGCSFTATRVKAQSLPANTCGIVYAYDAAGNRTQRTYLCNNSNRMAYAPAVAENTTVQQVTQLFPNPTTGRFTVSFSQPLKNATLILLDMAGNMLQQSRKSGNQILFDLSSYGAGAYIVRVMDGSNTITFKVVKQ